MNVEGRNLCLLEGFKLSSSFRRENFSRKNLIEKIVDRDQGRGEKQAASSRDNSLLSCFYF